MSGASAVKVQEVLAKSAQALRAVIAAGKPVPAGFADKIAEIALSFLRGPDGRGPARAAILKGALDIAPGHPDLCLEQANDLLRAGKPGDALPFATRADAARPNHAPTLHLLGSTLLTLWRITEALPCFERAVALQPEQVNFRRALAHALSTAGRQGQAADVWRGLLDGDPDNLEFLQGLAARLNDLGDIEGGQEVYRRILTLRPTSGAAHRMISKTQRYAPGHPHIEEMEATLSDAACTPDDRRDLHFALYTAHDGAGDHQAAFDHLEKANRLLGDSKGWSDGSERELIRRIKAHFTEDFARSMPLSRSTEEPIFIVGLPRSGSTLTEQILASHPDVAGAGEVMVLQDLIEREFYDHKAQTLRADMTGTAPEHLSALSRDYMASLRGLSGPAVRHTDKYLSNFLWIGVIRMLFPRARVIHCHRNPIANCFSIYSNYFSTQGLKYKARLEDIARYHLAYDDLMRHWHRLFPGFVHDLSYEKLTTDQEAETLRLLEHCGLDWNADCLNFHETRRAVKTASFSQVRQAMYSGVDRRTANYLEQLQPLIRILESRPAA